MNSKLQPKLQQIIDELPMLNHNELDALCLLLQMNTTQHKAALIASMTAKIEQQTNADVFDNIWQLLKSRLKGPL